MAKTAGASHASQILATLATSGIVVAFLLPWTLVGAPGARVEHALWDGTGDVWSMPLKEVVGPVVLPTLVVMTSFVLFLWSLRGNAMYLRVGSVMLFAAAVAFYLARFVPLKAADPTAALGAGFYGALLASFVGVAAASRAVRAGKLA
ncbi:MAG TPA: hypothetical protein VM889_12130 [Candidatus Thermoplasmatota archaeon]|nr:hypothetical protein [Candidatus Thermoplasmatota archaeon]